MSSREITEDVVMIIKATIGKIINQRDIIQNRIEFSKLSKITKSGTSPEVFISEQARELV